MKKLFFLLGIILSLSINAQLELKGLILGNKYDEDPYIETTLGGINGVLHGYTLNDGRLCRITFQCSDDGENISRIHESDVTRLVVGIETKYDIKFRKTRKNDYSDDWTYLVSKGGYSYFISTEHNEFMTPTTECTIYIRDNYLYKISNQEQQAKANEDF